MPPPIIILAPPASLADSRTICIDICAAAACCAAVLRLRFVRRRAGLPLFAGLLIARAARLGTVALGRLLALAHPLGHIVERRLEIVRRAALALLRERLRIEILELATVGPERRILQHLGELLLELGIHRREHRLQFFERGARGLGVDLAGGHVGQERGQFFFERGCGRIGLGGASVTPTARAR